jgi:hypothetical protein
MPPGDPIPASAMAAFRDQRDRALAELATAIGDEPQLVTATR